MSFVYDGIILGMNQIDNDLRNNPEKIDQFLKIWENRTDTPIELKEAMIGYFKTLKNELIGTKTETGRIL